MTALYNRHRSVIRPEEVLLIDDGPDNVMIGKEFGHKIFFVTDDFVDEHLHRFSQRLLEEVTTRSSSDDDDNDSAQIN